MNYWLSCALLFLFSFCSLSYEFLLAKILSDLSQNEILAQSFGIGIFLLGLGLGTGFQSLFKTQVPLRRLVLIECLLTGLIFVAGPFAYSIGFIHQLSIGSYSGLFASWGIHGLVGLIILTIGFLSGFEFPLVLQDQKDQGRYHVALAISYFGGLAAGLLVPLFLNPGWGPLLALQILGLLNFFCILILVFVLLREKSLSLWTFSSLLVPAAVMSFGLSFSNKMEQAYLKTFYFGLRIPELNTPGIKNIWRGLQDIPAVERHHSAYQKIDLVKSSANSWWAGNVDSGATVYLDKKLQFNERTQQIYHESMVAGAFNLAKRVPKRVLILGGGDGLLATELLKYSEIERIDLVELDPMMIEMAMSNPLFLNLNKNSLVDPKVRVHVADGFAYMRSLASASLDAILIDFPYPHSPDLLRLYSVEFYQTVAKAMAPNGFAIMDGPLYTATEMSDRNMIDRPHWIIYNTIQRAGFDSIFVFGPYEGFYFFTKEKKKLAFDYDTLPDSMSNAALVNTKAMNDLFDGIELVPPLYNSLFRPRLILKPDQ